jgi:hypothetical protein
MQLVACGPSTPHGLAPLDFRLQLRATETYHMHMIIIREDECNMGLYLA